MFFYLAHYVCIAVLNHMLKFITPVNDNTPAFDLWRDYIGNPWQQYYYLPDLSVTLVITLWAPILNQEALVKFLQVHGILLWVRLLCIASTHGYCSPRKKQNNKKSCGFNAGHFDLSISGHTLVVSCMLLQVYESASTLYFLLTFLLGLFSILSNLLVGDHYTSDIILGVTLPMFLYHSTLL